MYYFVSMTKSKAYEKISKLNQRDCAYRTVSDADSKCVDRQTIRWAKDLVVHAHMVYHTTRVYRLEQLKRSLRQEGSVQS
jgi:hypothetical protein